MLSAQAQAFNDADFRVPDQAGWCPHREPIDPAFPVDHVLRTDMRAHHLAGGLQLYTSACIADLHSIDPCIYSTGYAEHCSVPGFVLCRCNECEASVHAHSGWVATWQT